LPRGVPMVPRVRPSYERACGSADRFSFSGFENAFALHFLLECPQSLVDVVVANEYLQETFLFVFK
jgi:hypothetical protein